MTTVFISHSSTDKPLARRIARDLELAGFGVWLDEWRIRVGEPITQCIQKGLSESHFLVVMLSEKSVSSKWVEREWQAKFSQELQRNQIAVLPVLCQKCDTPPLLRDKKYADLSVDYAGGVQDLLSSLCEFSDLLGLSRRAPRKDKSPEATSSKTVVKTTRQRRIDDLRNNDPVTVVVDQCFSPRLARGLRELVGNVHHRSELYAYETSDEIWGHDCAQKGIRFHHDGQPIRSINIGFLTAQHYVCRLRPRCSRPDFS